jgi:hypothetical protein
VKFATFVLQRAVKRLGHHFTKLSDLPSAHQRTYLRLESKALANLWGWVRYVPGSYPGRLTLFPASESLALPARDPRSSWGKLAEGGLDLQKVPGGPDTITCINSTRGDKAKVGILADKLRACIDKVQVTIVLSLNLSIATVVFRYVVGISC